MAGKNKETLRRGNATAHLQEAPGTGPVFYPEHQEQDVVTTLTSMAVVL